MLMCVYTYKCMCMFMIMVIVSKRVSHDHVFVAVQIFLASGVVFRADSHRFVAYDAEGRVGVPRITSLGVGT